MSRSTNFSSARSNRAISPFGRRITSSMSPSGSNLKSGFVQHDTAGTSSPSTTRRTDPGADRIERHGQRAVPAPARQAEMPPPEVPVRMCVVVVGVDVDVEDVVGDRAERVEEVQRGSPALDDDAPPDGHGAQSERETKALRHGVPDGSS